MIHHKSIQVKNTPIPSRSSPAAALGLRPSSTPKGADHRSPPPLGPTFICYVAVRCLSRRYLLPLRVTWHRRLLTQSSAASASSLSRRRETSDANSCMLRPSPSGVRMCMSSLRPASCVKEICLQQLLASRSTSKCSWISRMTMVENLFP